MSRQQSNFNLGVSDKVADIPEAEILSSDRKLNRLVVDTVAYAGIGASYGVLLSLFFRSKSFYKVLGFTAGFGVGQAFHTNCHPYVRAWINNRLA